MSTDIVLPDDMTLEMCKDVLRSPCPDKYMMNKILDAGVELTVDECAALCKIGAVVNGYVFTKYMNSQGLKLYKFVNSTRKHGNHTYVQGFNYDDVPFSPHSQCSAGGLYFSDTHQILYFYGYYGNTMHRVLLYSYSRVYIEKYKYKADQFYIDLNTTIPLKFVIQKLKREMLDLLYKYNNTLRIINQHIEFVDSKQVSPTFFHNCIYTYSSSSRNLFGWTFSKKYHDEQIHKFMRKFTSDQLIVMVSDYLLKYNFYTIDCFPYDLITEDFCVKLVEQNYKTYPYLPPNMYINYIAKIKSFANCAQYAFGTVYSPEFMTKLYDICKVKMD